MVAIVGFIFPWSSEWRSSNGSVVLFIYGVVLILIHFVMLEYEMRKVSTDDMKIFHFQSRRNDVIVLGSEITEIKPLFPFLDWYHIYPIMLKTSGGQLFLSRGINDFDGLKNALSISNPELMLN